MKKRILIAYFSATGVTRRAAEKLADISGSADLYEIKPAVPYTTADLNWTDRNSRSSMEMHDLNSRPAIIDTEIDMPRYDLIFVGFPIWWHMAPTIVNTFLEKHDFTGKEVVLFATSGGSGMDNSMRYLINSVSGKDIIKSERLLRGTESREELAQWIKRMEGN